MQGAGGESAFLVCPLTLDLLSWIIENSCCGQNSVTEDSGRRARVSGACCAIQNDRRCRLLWAAFLLAALMLAQEVSAASPTSTRGLNRAPHDCKCATKCRGDSCCCGPHEPQTRRPAPEPTPESNRADGSPCMVNSAPCGGSGIPNAPSEGPVSRIAALAMAGHLRHSAVSSLIPFSTLNLVPDRRTSRLDRPPECLILA
jgi:hypothetical protein